MKSADPSARRWRLPLAQRSALAAARAIAQADKVNLGVSIPAATHGFTGGIVYWANQAKKELEKAASRPEGHRQDRRRRAGAGQPGAGPADREQDRHAGDLPVRVGAADQAGRAGQGQGRLRHGGRPRPDRHERAGRLRRRRQHRLRQGPGRVHGQGAGRQGQHRRAARHPDRHRQRARWTRSTR